MEIFNYSKHKKLVSKTDLSNKSCISSPYQYLTQLARHNPKILNRIAISHDKEISYRDLLSRIDWLSRFLHFELKCEKGENIAICSVGCIEGIIAFFALNKLGLVNARVFNDSKEQTMLDYIELFQSQTIIIDSHNLKVLDRVIERTVIKNVIVLPHCSKDILEAFEKKHSEIKVTTWPQALVIGEKTCNDYEEKVKMHDLAAILYTSGSSGESKPISIPNRVYVNMVDVVCETTGIKKCDNERSISVVSHEYPYAAINCTIMVLLMGKTLLMPNYLASKEDMMHELMSKLPTRIQAIPNFYKLLENDYFQGNCQKEDFKRLHSIVSGGETYLESEKRHVMQFMKTVGRKPLLIDGFGFGELGSATALKFGSCHYFLLMNGMEAKAIHPETRKDLPLDETGILCITGPTLTDGYYRNTELTEKSFVKDQDGKTWFVSDTYGSVHGKRKRLIKLEGRIREYFITSDHVGNFVKVYAGHVEDVLMSSEVISDCIVVPSVQGGNPVPVAYVVYRTDLHMRQEVMNQRLQNACEALEDFAKPNLIIGKQEIMRTPAGKKNYRYYKE